MRIREGLALVIILLGACGASAALEERAWQIEGVEREALVWMPAATNAHAAPLVFAFHGHGGSMRNAARTFRIHEIWPEAVVVYMQGLPTPGQLTDPEGKKNGWNSVPNDPANRDLKFFDAVHASLVDRVDTNRIYCTGHSNGGGFTYCLWAARGGLFAAMAPSASAAGRSRGMLAPKPAMHIAGTQDTLVKYEWQARMMGFLKQLNQCADPGEPWATSGTLVGTRYPSAMGSPFVSLIYPGTHMFPREAPVLIVRFFKENPRIDTKSPGSAAAPSARRQ
jgi:polyhydroxybutyrate depolymerase